MLCCSSLAGATAGLLVFEDADINALGLQAFAWLLLVLELDALENLSSLRPDSPGWASVRQLENQGNTGRRMRCLVAL